MHTYTLDKTIRWVFTLAILFGILFLTKYLSSVLIPFFIAALLAYMLNPMVEKVQTKLKHRGLSVAAVLLGSFLSISLTLYILVPYLFGELEHMFDMLNSFVQSKQSIQELNQLIESDLWKHLINELKTIAQSDWKSWIQNGDYWALAQKGLNKILPGALGVLSGIGGVLSAVLGIFIILLYLVFMLGDYSQLKKEGSQFIPDHWRHSVLEFLREFDIAMNRYFRAQALIAFTVGIGFCVGFSIMGLPLAIFLGLFIGALNMVPYLQILGLIPAVFLGVIHALETGGSIPLALLWIAVIFVVIQIIQDAFLVPKFMGEITGLSPALILLSISIWGQILGFLGLIIAIPMTCVVLAYYKRVQKIIVLATDTRNNE